MNGSLGREGGRSYIRTLPQVNMVGGERREKEGKEERERERDLERARERRGEERYAYSITLQQARVTVQTSDVHLEKKKIQKEERRENIPHTGRASSNSQSKEKWSDGK